MDILDEVDAAVREKRSKWKYTPMREKSETDAIIDELLREFSSDGRQNTSHSDINRPSSGISESRRTEIRPAKTEQQERYEYEASVRRDNESKSEDSFYAPHKYDDYDDYEDGGFEDTGGEDDGIIDNGDFNSFMDSENDGDKGDIPKFRASELVKIILKILVLAVFGAFAVTGIINTVSTGINKFSESSGSGAADMQKTEFESVIYPLIVTETKDFESVSDLGNEELINIAVWELVINGKKSVFEDQETGDILFPQDQMTYIVEKLFGEDMKLNHSDSGIGDIIISYDKKKKQYIIPKDTDLYSYYPKVTDIAETDDTYTVYADCYKSTPPWNSGKADPEKRVMVTLKKTQDYYNIISLKTIPLA